MTINIIRLPPISCSISSSMRVDIFTVFSQTFVDVVVVLLLLSVQLKMASSCEEKSTLVPALLFEYTKTENRKTYHSSCQFCAIYVVYPRHAHMNLTLTHAHSHVKVIFALQSPVHP